MKMANVVSVQDITRKVDHPELKQTSRRKHIEDLLRRYPAIREPEKQEIVHFLATGPHLDVGLITGNEALRPKVEEIRKANPAQFRMKWHEALFFVIAVGGPAAFLLGEYLLF